MRFSLRSNSPMRTGMFFVYVLKSHPRAHAPAALIFTATRQLRVHEQSRRHSGGQAAGKHRPRLTDSAAPRAATHAKPMVQPPRLDARGQVAPIAAGRLLRRDIAV